MNRGLKFLVTIEWNESSQKLSSSIVETCIGFLKVLIQIGQQITN
ncbi:MAG: hypothetical protein WA066_02955 [Candidatus Omnitrophota bacterium]